MPIQTMQLPTRSNAIEYDPDDVAEVVNLLDDLPRGQGIAVDDAQEKAGAARVRARKMKEAVIAEAPDWEGKLRTHTIEVEGEGHYPALSIKLSQRND